ncbi:MAG TPA: DUF4912 domain-containing protein [Candidatus Wallbacteria bacterium]|nr:DUF4912 domain-containing protein [Candidatus Wallbacteria bacterium]
MIKKKASDAVEEPVKKTGAAKKAVKKSPVKAAQENKAEKTAKPAKAVKAEKIVKIEKTEKATKTEKPLQTKKIVNNEKSIKAEKNETKTKTVSTDKKPSAKTSKGHNRPTGKNKGNSEKAKKTAGTAKAAVAKEISKTAKTSTGKKEEDKSAARAAETTSVTSSQVENLYGRHYIIDTAQELPKSYGKDRLTVLVRDPEWIYAFWDVSDKKVDEVKGIVGSKDFENSKRVLRLHNVDENGKPVEGPLDIELTKTASSWYINVKPNFSYSVEYGYKTPAGKFVSVVKSNPVDAPSHKISDVKDEKWMVKDGEFKKLYELSGGAKIGMSSADIMQAMARGMKMEELSELASAGISSAQGLSSESLSSQVMAERSITEEEKKKQRKFWMVLNTELIVYGATEPDASVTIMGQPIKLREDGTFSIRMALPDTDIDIPVKGISNDRIDEITITPCVHKHTEYDKKENAE